MTNRRAASAAFVMFSAILLIILLSTNLLTVLTRASSDDVPVSTRTVKYWFYDQGNDSHRHPYRVGGVSGYFGTDARTYLSDNYATDDILNDIKGRIHEDPTLLSGLATAADGKVNFSEDEKILPKDARGELPGQRPVKAHRIYLENDTEWVRSEELWEALVKNAKETGSVEFQDIAGYTSAMYQADVDEDGVPEVIVEDSTGESGQAIVLRGIWNGEEWVLKLRLNCGYQPIEVSVFWTPPTTPPPPPSTTTAPPPPPSTTTTVTSYEKNYGEVATEEGWGGTGTLKWTGTQPITPDDDPNVVIPGGISTKETKTTTTAAATQPTATEKATSSNQPQTEKSTQPAAVTTAPPVVTQDRIVTSPPDVHTLPAVTEPDNSYIPPTESHFTDAAECPIGKVED
jgi:hypothetical protein